jgi:hypothetical protein
MYILEAFSLNRLYTNGGSTFSIQQIARCMTFFLGIVQLSCFDMESATIPYFSQCEQCLQTECDAAYAECGSSTVCRKRFRCIEKCGKEEDACRIACSENISDNTNEIKALSVCGDLQCGEKCDPCGASILEERGAACMDCVRKTCCQQASTCAKEDGCSEMMRSRFACRDPICAANDGFFYDVSQEHFRSAGQKQLDECLLACLTACSLGTDFTCNRNYTTPDGVNRTVLECTVEDGFSRNVLTGVDVEVWGVKGDPSSAIQADVDRTTGQIVVSLDGQFTGRIRLSHEGYFPMVFESSRPFVGREKWVISFMPTSFPDYVELLIDGDLDLTNRGVLAISGRDCTDSLAPGLRMNLTQADDQTQALYLSGTSLDPEASATFSSGTVLFVNVPPGDVIVSMVEIDTGIQVGVISTQVNAGEGTWVALFPALLHN